MATKKTRSKNPTQHKAASPAPRANPPDEKKLWARVLVSIDGGKCVFETQFNGDKALPVLAVGPKLKWSTQVVVATEDEAFNLIQYGLVGEAANKIKAMIPDLPCS
jgi:hypothetical protein